MNRSVRLVVLVMMLAARTAWAQAQNTGTFTPEVGQPGKDVVWVPSPESTVERMLDIGQITATDFVVDLGSGDGRNVIAAARRGARGLGVEFNPNMVELSKRNAAAAGVGDRAQFVEGDMFAADISKATALVLFLLPNNLLQLREKFLNLQPGARIVANTFGIQDWTPDQTVDVPNCEQWCSVLLYIVPAKVAGTWQVPQGTLTLTQDYQHVNGTLTAAGGTTPVSGRLRGTQITLTAEKQQITGQVNGNRIEGTLRAEGNDSSWSAVRAN